jgi:anaerobic magnesium-protoporphyrin IX monomethyl ester cyclase
VGISAGFPDQIEAAIRCALAVRKVLPAAHIVLGGAYVSCHMRNVREKRFFEIFDSLVLDDGERPLESLHRELGKRVPDLSQVPSLIWLDNARGIRRNPSAAPVSLADTPPPDYGAMRLDRYVLPRRMIPLLHRLSRGCGWHRCAFCRTDLPMISCYEQLSGDTVFEHVQGMVEQTGCRIFHFTDDSSPPEVLEQFARRVIESELEIRWITNLRFDPRLTIEACQLLRQSGCHYVNIGLESYNDRLLKLLRKGTTTGLVDRVMSNCAWGGLKAALYMMVGVPTETEEEARASFVRVCELVKSGVTVGCMYNRFSIVPYSDVAHHPAHYGITRLIPPEGADLDPPITNFEGAGMDRDTTNRLHFEFVDTLNSLFGFHKYRKVVPTEVPTPAGSLPLRHDLASMVSSLGLSRPGINENAEACAS